MPRRPASVRIRTTIAAVIVVGLALAVGGVLLVSVHRSRLEQEIEASARLRADDVIGALQEDGLGADPGLVTADSPLTQVIDRSGHVVSASPDLGDAAAMTRLHPTTGTKAVETLHQLGHRNGAFRVVAKGTTAGGRYYTVAVAQSLEPAEDSAANLAALLAAGLPLLLLLVGGMAWLVTGRALRPVESIRREVESIGAGDLHRRVPTPESDDEIARLARTMNAMLGRLEDADEAQRRFVADASHELRTPLTGIRTQLEVDLAHPETADWATTARGVLEDTVSLQELVGDLLALADLEAGRARSPRREPVDLDDVVLAEVTRTRATTAVEIDARTVSGAQVHGDAGQLARLVRNLLDNGVRHATSRVTVVLVELDDVAVLTVANDGPEIPAADRLRIFERFARLDDARAADAGGTGLGLAIAHEIVDRHGGHIEVLDTPGTTFRVTLPLGTPPA